MRLSDIYFLLCIFRSNAPLAWVPPKHRQEGKTRYTSSSTVSKEASPSRRPRASTCHCAGGISQVGLCAGLPRRTFFHSLPNKSTVGACPALLSLDRHTRILAPVLGNTWRAQRDVQAFNLSVHHHPVSSTPRQCAVRKENASSRGATRLSLSLPPYLKLPARRITHSYHLLRHSTLALRGWPAGLLLYVPAPPPVTRILLLPGDRCWRALSAPQTNARVRACLLNAFTWHAVAVPAYLILYLHIFFTLPPMPLS